MNKLITYAAGGTEADGPIKVPKIPTPSSKIVLFDGGTSYSYYAQITAPSGNSFYIPGAKANLSLPWDQSGYQNQYDAYSGRHGKKINIMWLDGHIGRDYADNLTDQKLWNRK